MGLLVWLMLVLTVAPTSGLYGQDRYQPDTAVERLDVRLLQSVYAVDAPWLAHTMQATRELSYPIFALQVPLAWGLHAAGAKSRGHLYATLPAGLVIAYGAQYGLKRVFRRPRPYLRHHDIDARLPHPPDPRDRFAFPSGHATAAGLMATLWVLNYPNWYAGPPVMLWSTSVSLSRPWLGVHYPGDVVAGLALGTGLGFGLHLAAGALFD